MNLFFPKKITRNSIISFLVFGMLLAPVNSSLHIQKTEAFFGGTIVLGDIPQQLKEIIGDNLAYTLSRAVISRMVESTVRWINSGFKGSPSFVTDLDGFLLSVGDEVAGDFIYGTDLGFLCEPFQLDIRAALAVQHYGTGSSRNPYACTLSKVGDNVDNFLDDAGDGGWGHWYQVTGQPQNNQYGAYALAQGQLNAQIRNARGEQVNLLDWAEGFLGVEICEEVEGGGRTCSIATPGPVIAESLNKALGAGQDSLIQADEINEIVGALLSQLATQVLGGAGGLLGVSGGTAYNNYERPYLDELGDEATDSENAAKRGLITQQIDLERQIQSQSGQIVLIKADAEATAEEIADEKSCTPRTQFPQVLVDSSTKAQEYNEKSTTNIRSLERMLVLYETAPEEALEQLESLKDFGVLYSQKDLTDVSYLQNDASIAASLYINDVTQECGTSA